MSQETLPTHAESSAGISTVECCAIVLGWALPPFPLCNLCLQPANHPAKLQVYTRQFNLQCPSPFWYFSTIRSSTAFNKLCWTMIPLQEGRPSSQLKETPSGAHQSCDDWQIWYVSHRSGDLRGLLGQRTATSEGDPPEVKSVSSVPA